MGRLRAARNMQAGLGPLNFIKPFLLPALLLIVLPTRAPSVSPPDHGQTPQWWEVSIHLKTDGDYKLDEGGPTFAGRYSFAVHWTGWLEKEDQDYLLYRLDCRLLNWEARETASPDDTPSFLTAEDFRERPVFSLRYIIRDGEDLCLDFIVGQMGVPQARLEAAFPLLLPSSERNGQRESQINYNAFVIKGSNRVELPESAIYAGPVAKTYAWTWKHQEWLSQERRTVLTSQSHNVKVCLSIIPHFARPKTAQS
jgi:hypothetical protein